MSNPSTFNPNFALKRAFLVLLFVHGGLILVNLLLGASFWFTFVNALVFAISVLLWSCIRSAPAYFLVSHPAWLFSFTAYVFSFLNGNVVDANLGAGDTAASLVLLYQVACVCAGIIATSIAHLLWRGTRLVQASQVPPWLARIEYYFLAVGVVGALLNALASWIPVSMAIVEFLRSFLWLGLAIHVCKRGRIFPPDLVILVWLALAALTAVLLNGRTPVLEVALFMGLAAIFLARRRIKARTGLFLFLGFSVLSAFSDVTLSVRSYGQTSSVAETIELYRDKILEPETLLNALFPWRGRDGAVSQDDPNTSFEIKYFRTGNRFLTRFVLLPQLDLLIPDVPSGQPIDWYEVNNIVLSVLPNFGQDKDTIFSDRLTWKIGLRSEDNVGRPMITAVGELYFIGGALFCFVALTILFSVLFIEIMILARLIEHPVVLILVVSQFLVYGILTTTAISLTAIILRTMPFYIVLLAALRAMLRKPPSRSWEPPRRPSARSATWNGSAEAKQ